MVVKVLASAKEILAAMVLLAATLSVAHARDGPPIVTHIATLSPTDTATVPPSPSPSPSPTATPSPSATPTPTETPDPVVEITAGLKVERSLRFLRMVQVIEDRAGYTPDPLLVVAVIAAESGGEQTGVSYAGACGIMQVIPKPWYGVSDERICSSTWSNGVMGIWILQEAIENAGGDVRLGLAYYNCAEEQVHEDNCGRDGGLHYADDVLTFWLPRVQAQVDLFTPTPGG